MKVLFLGDIVGRPGREAIGRVLPEIKKRESIDLVIINSENAAGGSGVTPQIAKELEGYGADVLTSGDHIWKKREIYEYLDRNDRLLRPLNYPPGVPGRGSTVVKTSGGVKVGVVNLVGRVFMDSVECPFRKAREEVKKIADETPVIIVDLHAEATSEKVAMGWYLDGRISALLGTHTHVQTADERILPGGTAYITDTGMTGPHDSVIGRKKDAVIERFITQLPTRFEMAENDVRVNGVAIDIDETTGKARSIKRVHEAA